MAENLESRCARLLETLGLAAASEVRGIRPLSGGVASDIAVITLPDRKICVKFALERLRVAEDWRAPPHRNRAEYAWLRAAAASVPDSVPQVYGWSRSDNGFAMEFLSGRDVQLWKKKLLAGAVDPDEALAVGTLLGQVHAASTGPGFDSTPFHNHNDFMALRIEPYLLFTAGKHPSAAEQLSALAHRLSQTASVLIHGDVSPKNILFRNGKPCLIDAECATLGDPSFDVAFCLNHLLLKAVHMPRQQSSLMSAATGFWEAYEPHVTWEAARALEERVAGLLPALMLARVDGKSPVEYLSADEQEQVRRSVLPLLAQPVSSLAAVIGAVSRSAGR